MSSPISWTGVRRARVAHDGNAGLDRTTNRAGSEARLQAAAADRTGAAGVLVALGDQRAADSLHAELTDRAGLALAGDAGRARRFLDAPGAVDAAGDGAAG